MRPLSRRRALQLGGLGAAGVLVGGTGLAWAGATRYTPTADQNFAAPEVLVSESGSLTVALEAAVGDGPLAGRPGVTTLRYNGGTPGPTLSLRPGDHLGVDLINHLDQPTNLHTHGLQVSPRGNSDNPFLMINPGQWFRYDYQIPADHPAGTFWYHPHHHGTAADQVFGGLYGAIIISGPTEPPVSTDRVLVVSDITLDSSGAVQPATAMQRMTGREGEQLLVNGQVRPRLTATGGDHERWRIVNACVSRYLRLRLDGQDLQLLGIDLPLGGEPQPTGEVLLAPGNRADLLVTTRAGTSTLQALAYNRGAGTAMGMDMAVTARSGNAPSTVDLATLTVVGSDRGAPVRTAHPQPAAKDLRESPVTAHRVLTMAMGMSMAAGGMAFTIDGVPFDPSRIDQSVQAGAVEEWTITNTSPMDHPFHLHVWPIQVLSIGGAAANRPTWQNVSTSQQAAPALSASPLTSTPAAPSTTATSSTMRTAA